jgi:methylase of polypeptide subunit release factors
MKNKNGGVDAPISISDLFNTNDDETEENNDFENIYEVQSLKVGNNLLKIRQSSWHKTNANIVWPGTFLLIEFMIQNSSRYMSGRIIELGSATGALAISLKKNNFDLITRFLNNVYFSKLH